MELNSDEKLIQYLELFERRMVSKFPKLEDNLYKKFDNVKVEQLLPKAISYCDIVKTPKLLGSNSHRESFSVTYNKIFDDQVILMEDIINFDKYTSGSVEKEEFHQTNETVSPETGAKSVTRLHQNKPSPLAMNSKSDKNRMLVAL
ncbi:hypothetical protein WA026_011237 [Henosepilachna vigintioctopunctata]|uniref:Uncharacterized protein n=1 Tax=Henosepilachna vigintioctopunctata TaxID=420089 RepID=A0AAW1U5A7_9CUCU